MTQRYLELKQQSVDKIRSSQLVAIIRLAHQSEVAAVVKCLVAGGVTTLEITANTPGYCEEISKARHLYPNVLIGAGTIINVERAQNALDAGAQFLVTPNTEKSIVDTNVKVKKPRAPDKICTKHSNVDVKILEDNLDPDEIEKSTNKLNEEIKKLDRSGNCPSCQKKLSKLKGLKSELTD